MPVEPTTRSTDEQRASGDAPNREWRVFTRETPTDPVIHAGAIRATDRERARERVRTLFPDVASHWLCPADAIDRDGQSPITAGEAT